ncbi:MAG: glycine betaine ABC transporter substrate-binding protein [Eubacteriaceae bacterium]
MKNLWKKFFIVLLSLIIVFSVTACSNSGGSNEGNSLPEEINFGILRVPNDETIAIAENLFDKYFQNLGITCNYIVFDSGREANAALASGSIDFAAMGNTNAIIALATGLDVEMFWIDEVLGEIEALAVKNGSGIDELNDLVGNKVAVPFASTSHYILLKALENAGIEDQVEILDMQTTEIVAAWERGDIQAAYVWQPSLSVLLEDGKVLISSEDMAKEGYITANVKVVRKDFSKKYPDLVADYIATLAEGGNIYRENAKNGAEIVAEELDISSEDALMQMQGSIWCTPQELLEESYFGTTSSAGNFATIMKDTADFLQEQNSIDTSPSLEDFKEFVNPLYIEKYMETIE